MAGIRPDDFPSVTEMLGYRYQLSLFPALRYCYSLPESLLPGGYAC